jgi:hypothetical protein
VAVVATLSKGYDLDYIWKQVDRGPAKDAASYYIQASETGGEPPGRWWGPGAKALGFEAGQTVERQPYDLLFASVRLPTAPGWASPRTAAAKPPTCTSACWPPSRTPPPNADASCGFKPAGKPGKAPSSST